MTLHNNKFYYFLMTVDTSLWNFVHYNLQATKLISFSDFVVVLLTSKVHWVLMGTKLRVANKTAFSTVKFSTDTGNSLQIQNKGNQKYYMQARIIYARVCETLFIITSKRRN
jgi:hypothetical protein